MRSRTVTLSTYAEDIAHAMALFEPFHRQKLPVERLVLKIFNKVFGLAKDDVQRSGERRLLCYSVDGTELWAREGALS